MDAKFWHERWELNQIAFHLDKPNPFLVSYFDRLSLAPESRVFVPLCGKSLDIPWLLSHGMKVVGVELSRIAVDELFKSLELVPVETNLGNLTLLSSKGLKVFVGDVFNVTQEALGEVDAVYDRAALVALPHSMRVSYSAHISKISRYCKQLLVTYEYDQTCMEGPPFSVMETEVRTHYGRGYEVEKLKTVDVEGGLRGKCPASNTAWMLTPKN